MPYILKEGRKLFDRCIEAMPRICAPGELNYVITKIIHRYAKKGSENYSTYNEIIGVLECAKQEFYRTVVAPYEEEKRKENGDI